MRTRLITTLLCLHAVVLAAQAPRLEIRAQSYGVLTKRTVATGSSYVEQSGTVTGGELSLRIPGIGATARILSGTLSGSSGDGGKLTSGQIQLQVGPRIVGLEAGYTRRAFTSSLATTLHSFYRAGIVSVIDIGGTGLTARSSFSLLRQTSTSGAASGHNILSMLEYRLPRTPIVAALGYSSEIFELGSGTAMRPESVAGVVLGAGLRLGL